MGDKRPKGFQRPRPPTVVQLRNETCWAAALESWLRAAAPPNRQHTQKELLQNTEKLGKGIDVVIFRSLVAGFGMDTVLISGVNEFSADRIEERLRNASVLLVGFELETFTVWWHDVVLYGVTIPPNDEPKYDIMDPAKGAYLTVTKGHFFPAGFTEPVLIGWAARGRPGKSF
jgi:hypothetical protein